MVMLVTGGAEAPAVDPTEPMAIAVAASTPTRTRRIPPDDIPASYR